MATTYQPTDVERPTYDVPVAVGDVRAAAGVNDAFVLIGRILLALIFVASGAEKFMDLAATAAAIESKNLPIPQMLAAYLPSGWTMPYVLAVKTAVLEFAGGVLIIIGWQTRLFALLLAIFTAIAAYFFHDFWHYPPGAEHTNNMIHFMKNVSMIGGLIVLAGVGAGRFSLDGPCIRPQYLR